MKNPFQKASEFQKKKHLYSSGNRGAEPAIHKTDTRESSLASTKVSRNEKKKRKKPGKSIASFFKPKVHISSQNDRESTDRRIGKNVFVINTSVVGTQFKKEGLQYFRRYKVPECILEREPSNRFDENAILVILSQVRLPLGHVPRTEASFLAFLIDRASSLQSNGDSFSVQASIPVSDMHKDDFARNSFPLKIVVEISDGFRLNCDLKSRNVLMDMKARIAKLDKRLKNKVSKKKAKKQRNKGPQQQSMHRFAQKQLSMKAPQATKDSAIVFGLIPDVVLKHVFLSIDFTMRDFGIWKLVCKRWHGLIKGQDFMKFYFAYHMVANGNLHGASSSFKYLDGLYNWCYEPGHSSDAGWSSGIPTSIIDIFQFVEKTFSKKTTIDKQSVVDMFNDIPLFRGESKLVSLANDGLSALTAVVVFSNPEVVHHLVALLFNRRHHYLYYSDQKTYSHVKHILSNFGNANSHKFEWIYSILVIFWNGLHDTHYMKMRQENFDPSGEECWYDRAEIILSSLRSADSASFDFALRDEALQLKQCCVSTENNGTASVPESRNGVATPAKSMVFTRKDRVLTSEQQSIVWAKLSSNDIISVNAFAGTGKTTTLVKFASVRPSKKILYLVFNVSIREEAANLFPSNTDVKSFHALAFSKYGYRYARKLKPELKTNIVMKHREVLSLPKGKQSPIVFKAVVDTISNFCNSADSSFSSLHVPDFSDASCVRGDILEASKRFFDCMKSVESHVPMTHAGYLKLYAMSAPRLDEIYDIIMVDEAQDINPVIQSIVLSQQNAGKIFVGDSHQSIYSFSGSKNTLRSISPTKSFQLTKCFRFGWKISSVANVLLRNFTSERNRVAGMKNFGNKARVSVVPISLWHIWDHRERKHPFKYETYMRYTIVARTNQKLWELAMDFLSRKMKFVFVGGVQGYNLQRCIDIARFLRGDAKVKANNAFLAMFKTPEDLHNFAEKTQDSELLRCWNTCNQYGVTTVVNGFKAMMRQSEKYENMSRLPHDVVGLGTVHKVKGLEFDCVLIANDFIDLGDEQNKSSICSNETGFVDEFNMVYVAITRAKVQLRMSHDLYAYFTLLSRSYWHMDFQVFDELKPTLENEAETCCVECGQSSLWSRRKDASDKGLEKCNVSLRIEQSIVIPSGPDAALLGYSYCRDCAERLLFSEKYLSGFTWYYLQGINTDEES